MLTPKNWNTFQHYKDRSPKWIKLHRSLLDSHDYFRLSPDAGKLLPLVWLVASDHDGVIPCAGDLAFRLRLTEELVSRCLAELEEHGFLIDAEFAEPAEQDGTPSQRMARAAGWGSRHISDVVKREVWVRDGGKCCACPSTENIEFDHKTPVSKGGDSSASNIQLLCRPCNRAKRTRVATQAEPLGRTTLDRRSLEERRGETEGEKNSRRVAPARASKQIDLEEAIAAAPSPFDEFWRFYPRREGPNPKAPAEKRFAQLVKTGLDPAFLVAEVKKFAALDDTRKAVGSRFIPQAVTWLNQQRWSDHAAVAALSSIDGGTISIEDAVKQYASFRKWPRGVGPEPGLVGCKASAELLAAHGLRPDGGKISLGPRPFPDDDEPLEAA